MKEQELKRKLIEKRKAIKKKMEDLRSGELNLHESFFR